MIASLEIADMGGFSRRIDIFGRARGLNRGDRLIVRLDNDVVILDLPQHPGDARDTIGLIVAGASRLLAALRIPPPTRIRSTAGILTTRVASAGVASARIADTRNNNLAEHRNADKKHDG